MKPGTFAALKNNYLESLSDEQDTNLPSPGPVHPVPRLSKASETVQAEPRSSKRKKEYPDSTVTLKVADGYTPSYMDFYKDTAPPLVQEEEAPERGSLVRRNSIDERGREREGDELRKGLEKMDVEYCRELEYLKHNYRETFHALTERIEELQGGRAERGTPDFYRKLNNQELSLMFDFVDSKHAENLAEVKQHYDLQHMFLMDAMRTTSDRDDETRYNLSISENNEQKTGSVTQLNRSAQAEKDEILKAIERINFASAIAED